MARAKTGKNDYRVNDHTWQLELLRTKLHFSAPVLKLWTTLQLTLSWAIVASQCFKRQDLKGLLSTDTDKPSSYSIHTHFHTNEQWHRNDCWSLFYFWAENVALGDRKNAWHSYNALSSFYSTSAARQIGFIKQALRLKSDFCTLTFSFFPDEPEARSLTPKLSRSELIEILDSLANEIPETHRKRLRYGLFWKDRFA